jgi:hypothetical protein
MENDALNKAIDLLAKDIESVVHDGMFRKVIDVSYRDFWQSEGKYIRFTLEDLSDGHIYLDIKKTNKEYAKWRRLLLIKFENMFGPEKYPYKEDNKNWFFDEIEVTYATFAISFDFLGDSLTKYLRDKALEDLLG